MYHKFLKRIFDIVGAIVGLVLLLPLLLCIGILLAISNYGTPFFFQCRPGKDGKVFRIVKFKTMNDKRGNDGRLLPDSERIHKLGRFVRSTSIDELPQMINVLFGHMSFIGPRPLLKEYLPLYTPQQACRHKVRPGITGWAQVNGRNAISWEQKFEYDIWYIKNLNFKLDIKIIWMTIQKIVIRDGINSHKSITMIPFDIYCQQSRSDLQ
ncbi:sugar transferase [Dysgonomonas sp. Marseille-P4677]|uniref:sugar transferase n=1 Tax=Dysgonomonas sp. Marseille-P4677 TaxID=2364790 RepID=UPI001914BA76|nr:sugar transferase [Dysgonomonas sp. Marseille-P4677]MBK5721494.1 sugar transferase [Dysgonomonas sp. Marseille-P4677]